MAYLNEIDNCSNILNRVTDYLSQTKEKKGSNIQDVAISSLNQQLNEACESLKNAKERFSKEVSSLSAEEKQRAGQTLNDIQNKITPYLNSKTETISHLEMAPIPLEVAKTLKEFNRQLQETMEVVNMGSPYEQNLRENAVTGSFRDDPLLKIKHIRPNGYQGYYLRPASKEGTYILQYFDKRVGSYQSHTVAALDGGIFLVKDNKTFSTFEELLSYLNLNSAQNDHATLTTYVPQALLHVDSTFSEGRLSKDQVNQWFSRMNEITTEYLKEAQALFAYSFGTDFLEIDEDLLTPIMNAPQNRFKDVPAVVKTLTHVDIQNKQMRLHANHIRMEGFTQKFIAGQAPVPSERLQFWQALLENGSDIIELTTKRDNLSLKEQPYDIYPNEVGETKLIAPLHITLNKKESKDDGFPYTEYTYTVKSLYSNEEKTITRKHYDQWIDFKSVDVNVLDKMVNSFSNSEKELFVHCRAGVGRTGTFIVAAYLKEGIEKGLITKENLHAVLEKLVLDGRTQRSRLFVQSHEQFELLYNYAHSLLEK